MSRFALLAAPLLFALLAVPSGADEWKSAGTWKGHGPPVHVQMTFTGDAKTLHLASGTTVKTYDVAAGKERGTGLKHRYAVAAVHASEDGKTLLTLTRDGSLCTWDPATAKTSAVVRVRCGTVGCAAFSADGKTLAVFGSAGSSIRGNAVTLWEVPSGKAAGQLLGDAANVNEVRFSADGKSLAVVVDSFHQEKDEIVCLPTLDVRLWDVSGRKLTRTLIKSGNPRFADDGKSVALLRLDGKVGGAQLIDPGTGKSKADFTSHKDGTRTIDFASGGKMVATGGQDGLVKVWDERGKEKATLKGHNGAVVAVVISRDGKVIASAGDDRTVRLWALKE